MEEKILNEEESLELISQMIRNTKHNLESGKGKPFLIFGYISIAVSIAVYALLVKTDSFYVNLLWWAIPVLGGLTIYAFGRIENKYVKTYIDRTINTIWGVIGTVMILISFSAFFVHNLPMVSIMLLMSGMATTLTGFIIKYPVIIICGILGTLTCTIPFIVNGYAQVLIFAAAIFIMMVIPGHFLNFKGKNTNV